MATIQICIYTRDTARQVRCHSQFMTAYCSNLERHTAKFKCLLLQVIRHYRNETQNVLFIECYRKIQNEDCDEQATTRISHLTLAYRKPHLTSTSDLTFPVPRPVWFNQATTGCWCTSLFGASIQPIPFIHCYYPCVFLISKQYHHYGLSCCMEVWLEKIHLCLMSYVTVVDDPQKDTEHNLHSLDTNIQKVKYSI